MMTFSIIGDTQRDQWHTIVDILRKVGGDMSPKGRAELCDELDRYIDHCEDILDTLRNEEK